MASSKTHGTACLISRSIITSQLFAELLCICISCLAYGAELVQYLPEKIPYRVGSIMDFQFLFVSVLIHSH